MKTIFSRGLIAAATISLALAATAPAATSVRADSSFYASTLPAGDDPTAGPIAMGFSGTFLGVAYNRLFINNNGSISFNGEVRESYGPHVRRRADHRTILR